MDLVTRRRLLGAALAGAAGLAASLAFWRRGPNPTVSITEPDVLFAGAKVFDGERFAEGTRDVLVRDGRIEAVERSIPAPAGVTRVEGGVLFPGFVDTHVHLSFSNAEAVSRGGVTTVLDLGEPLPFAFAGHPPLRFHAAGPLLTAPGGYPTTSWGAGGYGLEVDGPAAVREAVAMLADRGATMIKLAIEPREGPLLAADALKAATEAAHARGLKIAAHALTVDAVRAALEAGVDVLAHTPVETLPDDLIASLASRGITVMSTVRAFGARASTRANLAALAAAGCRVVYGTDLGNGGIRPGIDTEELEIISSALGDRTRALAAATGIAGAVAGSGGRLAAGGLADLVWVPRFDSFADLRRGLRVWMGSS